MNSGLQGFSQPSVIPSAYIYLAAGYSVPAGSTTVDTPFNTILYDTHKFYNAGIPKSFVVPSGLAGLYLMICACAFVANGTNHRGMYLKINNVAVQTTFQPANAAIAVPFSMTHMMRLNDGDRMSQNLYQNSGGALTTSAGSTATFMSITRLGDFI